MQASKMLVFIDVCRRNANIWYHRVLRICKRKTKLVGRTISSPRYMRKLLSQSRIFVYVMLKAFSPRKSGRVILKNNPPLRTICHGRGRPLLGRIFCRAFSQGRRLFFLHQAYSRDTTSNSPRLNW